MHMNNINTQPRELSMDEIEYVSGGECQDPMFIGPCLPRQEQDPWMAPWLDPFGDNPFMDQLRDEFGDNPENDSTNNDWPFGPGTSELPKPDGLKVSGDDGGTQVFAVGGIQGLTGDETFGKITVSIPF